MIVRPHPNALSLFLILRGSILRAVPGELVTVCGIAVLVVLLHGRVAWLCSGLTLPSFTLPGLALSIFLGFRNNVCYQRWWGARRQWGLLIAESRAFLRDLRRCCRMTPTPAAAWATAASPSLMPCAANCGTERWPLRKAGSRLRNGRLSAPWRASRTVHRTAWLFCALLPFGLVSTLGLATPVVSVILAYAFFGLDALGQELPAPFASTDNAVPLDALARVI